MIPDLKAELPKEGWHAWTVCLSSFIIRLVISGISYNFGIIFMDLKANFGGEDLDHVIVGAIGAINIATQYFMVPIASSIINIQGYQAVGLIGCGISCTFMTMAIFSNSIWIFLITYGLGAGIGMGMVNVCAMVVCNYYFTKHKYLGMAIPSLGHGIGICVMAPVIYSTLQTMSWQCVLLGFSTLQAILAIFIIPMKSFSVPVDLQQDDKLDEMLDQLDMNTDVKRGSLSLESAVYSSSLRGIVEVRRHLEKRALSVSSQGSGKVIARRLSAMDVLLNKPTLIQMEKNGEKKSDFKTLEATTQFLANEDQAVLRPFSKDIPFYTGSKTNLSLPPPDVRERKRSSVVVATLDDSFEPQQQILDTNKYQINTLKSAKALSLIGDDMEETNPETVQPNIWNMLGIMVDLKYLLRINFLILSLGQLITYAAGDIPILFLIPLAKTFNLDYPIYLQMVLGVGSFAGSALLSTIGSVSDRVTSWTKVIAQVLASISIVVFGYLATQPATRIELLAVNLGLYSTFHAMTIPKTSVALSRMFGMDSVISTYCLISLFKMVGIILGPGLLSGFILDNPDFIETIGLSKVESTSYACGLLMILGSLINGACLLFTQ